MIGSSRKLSLLQDKQEKRKKIKKKENFYNCLEMLSFGDALQTDGNTENC
jgi:hypothetical protein